MRTLLVLAAAALALAAAGARAQRPGDTGTASQKGGTGMVPSLVGVWRSVFQEEFESLPRQFLNKNNIAFSDVIPKYGVTRAKSGVWEDSSGLNGYYMQFTCDRDVEGGYTASYYDATEDRFLFEWGMVYKRSLGPYKGIYNVAYIRSGMKSDILVKRAVKLDKPDSAANPLTSYPIDTVGYCGFALIR